VLFFGSHHPPLPSLMCCMYSDGKAWARLGILARWNNIELG
jgi:hypothetical protein